MCCLPLSVANSPSFSAFNPASSYKVHIIGEDRHDEGSRRHAIGEDRNDEGSHRHVIGEDRHDEGSHRHAIGEDRHDEVAGCILMQRKQKERNSSIPVISIQAFCTPTHNKQ